MPVTPLLAAMQLYPRSHGATHYWLDRLDSASRASETDASLQWHLAPVKHSWPLALSRLQIFPSAPLRRFWRRGPGRGISWLTESEPTVTIGLPGPRGPAPAMAVGTPAGGFSAFR